MVAGASGPLLPTDIGLLLVVMVALVDRDIVPRAGSRREALTSSGRPCEKRRH
jgi:hypothetical protein